MTGDGQRKRDSTTMNLSHECFPSIDDINTWPQGVLMDFQALQGIAALAHVIVKFIHLLLHLYGNFRWYLFVIL